MVNELTIRNAEPGDISLIGYLAHTIWPETYGEILSNDQLDYMLELIYSPSALRRQMMTEQHRFFIAELDNKPIGFASFGPLPEPNTFKLHKLYVLPGIQGKGIGKALVEFIVKELEPEKAQTLLLNVNRHNKAKTFYERLGFEIIKEEDIDIGNGYFMNDYVMALKLNRSSLG
jgi:ribosomal protein S18 acetylase RimI-like enzyme